MEKAFNISNMVRRFPGFKLGPLDLDLNPGTALGYIGPNGSGKSTTIHCLAGFLKPESGTIEIFGRNIESEDADWKQEIGYVGEANAYYERWTGEKNLNFLSRFYKNWSNKKVEKLAKRFVLPLDKKAADLSKGNRVKLSLIAALAHSPKLLLLDEPTAGLDPVVRDEVLESLFEVLEDGERAIFYSTHILTDISRLADDLAFLVEGKIIQKTAKEDLIDKWRKISFKLKSEKSSFAASVEHQNEGKEYQLISSDCEETLRHLYNLGAENVQKNLMSIDEIAVQILKGENNVDAN